MVVVAGSGKKGRRTLNVSTPAALVAAAAGARIVKVGSAATSSSIGSRDLVQALGLPERRAASEVRDDLAVRGFAFVAVEPEIPTLDRIYGGRFYAPNPFSFGLAALASPVRGDLTVFGLAHPRVEVAAEVLLRLGLADVDVFTTLLPGGHYLDELAPVGEVRRCRVRAASLAATEVLPAHEMVPGPSFVLPAPRDARESVKLTADLLAGGGLDAHRRLVSLNAAHLMVVSGIARSHREGAAKADELIRSGAVLNEIRPEPVSAGKRSE